MKCRRIVNGNVVWFGSIGKTSDGKAIFVDNKQNYSKEQQAIVDCLTQKLSVIQNELWYNINYGIPLFNKYKNKAFIDAYITSEIFKQQGVKSIISFDSTLSKYNYSCKFIVDTIYGQIELKI